MDPTLLLRGKYTFRSAGRKLILVKKPVESVRHVVMKALLWALYRPCYPEIAVEVPIGGKYKPDLVQTGPQGPVFWGEAGTVSTAKLRRILKRFSRTHFALAAWGGQLSVRETRIRRELRGISRAAPVDIIRFSTDADGRFVATDGTIGISHDDVDWLRID